MYLALYFVMFMWYVGIMSDFYITYKDSWFIQFYSLIN
jgi:hypothetical protein